MRVGLWIVRRLSRSMLLVCRRGDLSGLAGEATALLRSDKRGLLIKHTHQPLSLPSLISLLYYPSCGVLQYVANLEFLY